MTCTHLHGPVWLDDRRCRLTLWAPAQRAVHLLLDGQAPMTSAVETGGWHHWTLHDVPPGTLYRFQLQSGPCVPVAG